MESKFTAYLLHKFLEQTDTNLVFPVSIRMRPSKKAYKTSIFETNLVNSYRIMFDFSCLLSGRSRVRIPTSVPRKALVNQGFFVLHILNVRYKSLLKTVFDTHFGTLFYIRFSSDGQIFFVICVKCEHPEPAFQGAQASVSSSYRPNPICFSRF